MNRQETITLNESELRQAILYWLEHNLLIKIYPNPTFSFEQLGSVSNYSHQVTIRHETPKK